MERVFQPLQAQNDRIFIELQKKENRRWLVTISAASEAAIIEVVR
jgi:hypothetical protein